MKIDREARIAISRGLQQRGVTRSHLWEAFAGDQGLGRPSGIIDRVERDFGEPATREMLEIVGESIREREVCRQHVVTASWP